MNNCTGEKRRTINTSGKSKTPNGYGSRQLGICAERAININVAGAAVARRRGKQDCEQMEIIIGAEDLFDNA